MKRTFTIAIIALFCYTLNVVSNTTNKIQNYEENNFFVVNKGQWDERALFLSKMQNLNYWITKKGVVYDYYQLERDEKQFESDLTPNHNFGHITNHIGHVIFSELINSNENPIVEQTGIKQAYHNYFLGNDQSKWQPNVPLYSNVTLKNIYSGVDVTYFYEGNNVRHDYIVHPYADPSQIKIKFTGQTKLSIDTKGDLVLLTSLGEIVHTKLFAFQNTGNIIQPVECNFVIENGNSVRFALGNYDKSKTLVIDPVVRTFSTYLGSTSTDYPYSSAIDENGFVYLTGYTSSAAFPITSGAYQTTISTTPDCFITKFNSNGSGLVFSTFLGGNNSDYAIGIEVDQSNNIYVAGYTYSSNFPTTVGAFRTTVVATPDVFATKLSSGGNSLIYSTYLGGSSTDIAYGMTIDNNGFLYVVGYTNSTNYPTTTGAYRTTQVAGVDVFLTKVSQNGQTLAFSTYLGGSSSEYAYGVVVDNNGSAYVTGYTASNNFPVTSGAYWTSYTSTDVFVTKFNPDGSALVYSTYMPGNSIDVAYGIAVDGSGQATVAGYTNSSSGFPLINAFRTTLQGVEGFVTKFNANGSGLIFSTYIGGSSSDYIYDAVTDADGQIYVGGYTASNNLPMAAGATQPTSGGGNDGILYQLSPTGQLLFSTYIGGSSTDIGYYFKCLDINANNEVSISGYTTSTNFPVSATAYQKTRSTSPDGWVQKYTFDPPNKIFLGTISPTSFCAGDVVVVNFTTQGTFKSDNQFLVELSDETGSFSKPTLIGAISAVNAHPINCSTPENLMAATGYLIRVRATNPSAISDLSKPLTVLPKPKVLKTLGDGGFCTFDPKGAEIRMEATEKYTQYQLYRDGQKVGSPIIGTGGEISFGHFKSTGLYRIEAISTSGCKNWMSGDINVREIPAPIVYNVTGGGQSYNENGTGTYCEGGEGVAIGLNNSQLGVKYQLKHNGENLHVPILGTGDPISFGFITAPGKYTIEAYTVTGGCPSVMNGSINVTVLPAPHEFDFVANNWLCEGSFGNDIKLINSEKGIIYQLLFNGKKYGNPVTGNGNPMIIGKVRDIGKYQLLATNPENNCTRLFTKEFELKPIKLPRKFELSANTHYCEDSEGSEFILKNSEENVVYQLMNGNNAINEPVLGTGAPISLGFSKQEGSYHVIGKNLFGGCESNMLNAVQISSIPRPMSDIEGNYKANINSVETYKVLDVKNDDQYDWSVVNGEILGANNKPEITVKWGETKFGKVELTRKNSSGCINHGALNVEIVNKIVPNFYAEKLEGDIPFTVHFKNASSGYITYYNWDFGDGNSSPSHSPVYTYKQPGKYTVTLTVGYQDVRVTETKVDFVVVHPAGSVKDEVPETNEYLELLPIVPNPVNNVLSLKYNSHREQPIVVKVYDIFGNVVATSTNIFVGVGINSTEMDLSKLHSGTYFVQIETTNGNLTKFFNLIK